jgi:hypothetical protein
MNKQEFGIKYLLNNFESNMKLLPIVIEMKFNMTVDQFIEAYFEEDEEGYYINI